MSYREGEGGKLLVHCHAGCSFAAIVDALGVGRSAPRARASGSRKTEVASYAYEDEGGAILFEQVRFSPKGFAARRKDGSGQRVWNLQGVRVVPYRLPRVIAGLAAGETIWIAEGEKDVDALERLGLCATTNHGGAGKWKEAHSHVLQSARRVVLLPDNDEPGRTHARKVAAALRGVGVVDVRIVPLPGLAEKADVSDWLLAGGTREELERLADSTVADVEKQPLESSPAIARSGSGLVTSSTRLELAVQTLGRGRPATIVVREVATAALLATDTVRLESNEARERFVQTLPVEHQQEARALALTLAAELAKAPPAPESRAKGEQLLLEDPEPHPSAEDPVLLLAELLWTLRRFVWLPEESAVAVALWVLHAYCLEAFELSPILCITSPEKRCGKTRLLILVGALVPRELRVSSITPAAIFRAIEAHHPTLLVDEADTFIRDNEELRGILNSGHTRGTARVIRVEGDKEREARIFSTWAAKVIALIGDLPSTLEDRSIVVSLRRKLREESVERMRQDRIYQTLAPLRSRCARFAADYLDPLREADPLIPGEIEDDRAADNWRPLIAIADAAGKPWAEMARAAFVKLSGGQRADAGPGVQLLQDIREILPEIGEDPVRSQELVDRLVSLEGGRWAEWNRGKPLSATGLARLLKPFGIQPTKVRLGADTVRGYRLADMTEAISRYGGPQPEQAEQPANFAGADNFQRWNSSEAVPGLNSCSDPRKTGAVPSVPDGTTRILHGDGNGPHARGNSETPSSQGARPCSDSGLPISRGLGGVES